MGLGEVWKGWMGGRHKSRVIDGVIGIDGDSGTEWAWVRLLSWVAGMST